MGPLEVVGLGVGAAQPHVRLPRVGRVLDRRLELLDGVLVVLLLQVDLAAGESGIGPAAPQQDECSQCDKRNGCPRYVHSLPPFRRERLSMVVGEPEEYMGPRGFVSSHMRGESGR